MCTCVPRALRCPKCGIKGSKCGSSFADKLGRSRQQQPAASYQPVNTTCTPRKYTHAHVLVCVGVRASLLGVNEAVFVRPVFGGARRRGTVDARSAREQRQPQLQLPQRRDAVRERDHGASSARTVLPGAAAALGAAHQHHAAPGQRYVQSEQHRLHRGTFPFRVSKQTLPLSALSLFLTNTLSSCVKFSDKM